MVEERKTEFYRLFFSIYTFDRFKYKKRLLQKISSVKVIMIKLRSALTFGLILLTTIACTTQPKDESVSTSTTDSVAPVSEVKENAKTKSGKFASGEHPTQGTVNLVDRGGKSSVEIQSDFQTKDGPDLVVILHRSQNVLGETKPPIYPLKEGDYVVLAPLQKSSGAQSYSIPANINLADYQSVAVWCRQFNATFGAAALE